MVTSPGKAGHRLARRGEALAAWWFRFQGFVVEARNWRCGHGEIDLVVRRRRLWVFVEVKTRRSTAAGRPEDAVDRHKQEQLVRLAHAFLHSRRLGEVPCRFDVVAIRWSGLLPRLRHYRHAFRADGLV